MKDSPPGSFFVTDDYDDAPDGAVVYDEDRGGWYERTGERWDLIDPDTSP